MCAASRRQPPGIVISNEIVHLHRSEARMGANEEGQKDNSMASTTKFTEKAQEAILNAQRETESRNISQFEPVALLLALLDQSDGLVPETLRKLGVDPAVVRRDATTEFD